MSIKDELVTYMVIGGVTMVTIVFTQQLFFGKFGQRHIVCHFVVLVVQ